LLGGALFLLDLRVADGGTGVFGSGLDGAVQRHADRSGLIAGMVLAARTSWCATMRG
jgi:hypothetical protein